ncbi:helix-turn-helix transcriptional regulator [Streptomyces sp. NPDC007157]|uniref:helix-turn-helix transcriptional regulator n=1 Tax=Streptomyces sp. NPDC007157 TaxID=3154681 RepID=UPI00340FE865
MIEISTAAGDGSAWDLDVESTSSALPYTASHPVHPAPRIWATGLILAASMTTSCFIGAPSADALTLGDHTTRPIDAVAEFSVPIGDVSVSGTASDAPNAEGEDTPKPDTAELIRELHDQSGLTWEQLGKILGVSRRSVHLWASGGRMNARHVELVTNLATLVHRAPVRSPERVRTWLLAPNPNGPSPVEAFKARHRPSGTVVNEVGYTASQLIGQDAD